MENVPDYIRLMALVLAYEECRFGKGNNLPIDFENSHTARSAHHERAVSRR